MKAETMHAGAAPLPCPKCRGKTESYVLPITKYENLPVYCRRCKETFILSTSERERRAET